MFTGLIIEMGEVSKLSKSGNSYALTIKADKALQELKLGDSVAVNGTCLTVIAIADKSFTVDVMPETTQSTTISSYKSGTRVNLERTLRLIDRLDGHIVSGHVDAIGTIAYKKQDEIAWRIGINIPSAALRYVVHKGSIAIDGISLTVTAVTDEGFEVSIIPHTLKLTTLGYKSIGDQVNIETDILGKYIEKLITGNTQQTNNGRKAGLSLSKLAENGFI